MPPSAPGQKIQVSCMGKTIYPESAIMYWLANGTFVDQLYPTGTVKEEATVEKGNLLTRELIFFQLTAQDLHTRFDCFITDPSGVFQKTIQWVLSKTKRRKCSAAQGRNWTRLHGREAASPGIR
ncbi:hypothetical protein E2320_005688 [Naja naja]|nr:hypothetical protein E2320_005688 [Naja naja]